MSRFLPVLAVSHFTGSDHNYIDTASDRIRTSANMQLVCVVIAALAVIVTRAVPAPQGRFIVLFTTTICPAVKSQQNEFCTSFDAIASMDIHRLICLYVTDIP